MLGLLAVILGIRSLPHLPFFPLDILFSMTGAWVGPGLADGARGWAAGMIGFGVFYPPGFGVPAARSLGTQPLWPTQALFQS